MMRSEPELRRRRQLGLSLVELAVAMVIVGVAATMTWQTVRSAWDRDNLAETRTLMERAEAAVLTFIALNGRMPCPAASPNGVESCGGGASGYFPFRTVGVPEARAAYLRYTPNALALTASGKFQVLANSKAIAPDQAPEAVPVALKSVATRSYDGILDMCKAMSELGAARGNAFMFERLGSDAVAPDLFNNPDLAPAWYSREVLAAEVSGHLSCSALVSMGGRSQYNAHLAAAIMAKNLVDYKWIFEADYATYALDVAEGVWTMANRIWAEVTGWPKTLQVLSAISASRGMDPVSNAQLPASLAAQTASTAAYFTQTTNLARFVINLNAARDRYKIINNLVARAVLRYDLASRHAVQASSSAYFLKEQGGAAAGGAATLGAFVASQPNAQALQMLQMASDRVKGFGWDNYLGDATTFPTDIADFGALDYLPLGSPVITDWDLAKERDKP